MLYGGILGQIQRKSAVSQSIMLSAACNHNLSLSAAKTSVYGGCTFAHKHPEGLHCSNQLPALSLRAGTLSKIVVTISHYETKTRPNMVCTHTDVAYLGFFPCALDVEALEGKLARHHVLTHNSGTNQQLLHSR